jgi:RND family efflux transporter MFP subunit
VEDVAVTSIPRARRAAGHLLLALAAGGVGGCSGEPARAEASRAPRPAVPPPAAVGTPVEEITLDAPLSLPAQLYVERDAVIAARAAGEVVALLVDLGTPVRAGALLATIESADQRLELARAEAAQLGAEQALSRVRALTRAGGVTGAEVEQAELAARQAALALAQARRELALTRVTAPFAGVVSARYVRAHRLVSAGDTLFRLTERAPLLVRVHVPEAQAGALRMGALATVRGAQGARTTATVSQVAPAVDAASGTREVVLRVAQSAALLPGSGVTVELAAGRRPAVVVPRALVDDGYVLVVQDGRAVLRAVTLGAEVGDGRVEVLGGLAPGERVARPGR